MICHTGKNIQHLAMSSLVALIVISGMLLSASRAFALPGRSGYSTGNQAVPRIEAVDCSVFEGLDVSGVTVQCGYLIVPENRSNPQSRTIKVAYALVKTSGSNPQPDPLVFLTGGPGGTAINGISGWSREDRDTILVDPRGLGYSQPIMQCPPQNIPGTSTQATAPFAKELLAQNLQWAQSCRDLLVSQGFDLTAYNTMASAGDLNDLRQALGYSEWNLYGISYGTRLALETMRTYPAGIRSVVLDSVLPPGVNRLWHGELTSMAGSFIALFSACKADPACNHDYPDLESKFYETIQHFDKNPVRLTVADGNSGKTKQVWINGATIIAGIEREMMFPNLIQIAPITIAQVYAGNYSSFENLYSNLDPGMNWAIYNTVICHDVGGLFNAEQFHAELEKYPALKSSFAGDEQAAICQLWGAGQSDPAEYQPVQSDIPTLLLTGGNYDPATPPSYAKLAASALTNGYLFEFPAYSHAVTSNECPIAMMNDFLNAPSSAPDSSCMAGIKGIPFFTNVYINPGVFNIYIAINFLNLKIWQSIVLGIIGILFLLALVILPIIYFRTRRRSPESQVHLNVARLILWIVAFLNLAFGTGAWVLVRKSLAETYSWGTLFGFSPASSGYLFIIPWLTAILGIVLLAFAFLAWKNRWWGRFEHIFYSLGTLASLGFTGILIYWKVLWF
jgi:pimeloyl-ACP methyl ester carboxylesterase